MAQTMQTTQSAPKRRTDPEQTGKASERGGGTYREDAGLQTAAFQALLSGVSPDRLPRGLAAEAAARIGNSAMEDLMRRSGTAEAFTPPRFPESEPQTAPFTWTPAPAAE